MLKSNTLMHWWRILLRQLFLYFRRYGTKCGGCGQGISPNDLVRKARDKVFHLNCFTCLVCRKQLSTGEELYVLDDNKFICKNDYLAGNKASLPGHHQGKSLDNLVKMANPVNYNSGYILGIPLFSIDSNMKVPVVISALKKS